MVRFSPRFGHCAHGPSVVRSRHYGDEKGNTWTSQDHREGRRRYHRTEGSSSIMRHSRAVSRFVVFSATDGTTVTSPSLTMHLPSDHRVIHIDVLTEDNRGHGSCMPVKLMRLRLMAQKSALCYVPNCQYPVQDCRATSRAERGARARSSVRSR
jgi:hypothetical protein